MFLDGEDWQRLLHGFSRSAFRLETLPAYKVAGEAEEIEEFLNGYRIDPGTYTSGWTDKLRAHTAAGRTVQRVHIVTRPLSDYLRYEFMYYAPHARAGEDIYILDLTDRPNPGLPAQDFWAFDDSTVVLMNYEPDGTQINRVLVEDDVEKYREWRRIAVAESVPFMDYVEEHGWQ
ncbi:hypothetical protein DR950_21260 [Kitasatospora xanthocidica]|uniref:DUF6879 domain-containing protein n=1 Tax=Kitasatospora xanthocidica TaxID=83382 RepID=A0A372ZVS0_9ACTN|nr:DUF6879 family protein [Kitasatospora xanthocidica]RGD59973.1 hypothetical protein DR950_21260 [Kitasatospora xanthocidica]